MKAARWVPLYIALVLGALTATYTYLERHWSIERSPIQALELKLLDLKFNVRGPVDVEPGVVIAAGDERTIEAWGRWGTWDRARFQRVLDNLFAAKADVVAFDMVFSDPVGIDAASALVIKNKALDGVKLSDRIGNVSVELDEGRPVAAPDVARIAMDAASLEDTIGRSLGGDGLLQGAFDKHTSRVVQGFIANSNPEPGVMHDDAAEKYKAIDSFSIKEYGYGWKLTQLDANAKSAGAEQQTAQLAAKEGGRASDLQRVHPVMGRFVIPQAQFLDVASNIGFFSADPDLDGTMRRLPLVYRYGDAFIPSLALSAAALHFGSTPVLIADPSFQDGLMRIGFPAEGGRVTEVPVDPTGALRINYYGPSDARSDDVRDADRGIFRRVSLTDIEANEFDKNIVRGKIVLVAVTAIGTFDQRVTPFSPIVPGTEIHAAAIQNMISGSALERPELHLQIEMLGAMMLALLLALVLPSVSVTTAMFVVVLLSGLWVAVDFLVLFRASLFFCEVPLQLQLGLTWAGITVWGYLTEGREKTRLKREFGTVLAPAVVEELMKNPALAGLGGTERELTVMFTDIRGFTTMSEKLSPEGLTQFLNEYLTPMTEILIQRQGTLDKYMGDAIMAFWGAPIEQLDHAARAALAALDMIEKLDELKLVWRAQGKPEIDIGIGLNSGLMRVGFMGSERMRNYTLLGDNVNLGSRLEGTNKSYGTHIIVSHATFQAAKAKVHGRLLDAVRVKGKLEPVRIYELVGKGTPDAATAVWIAQFELGLTHYRNKRFVEATACFHTVIAARGGKDAPSELYLERCEHFLAEPPPEEWDGVYEFKTK